VVSSFVKRILQLINSGETNKAAIAQVFGQYKELIDRAIFDKNQSSKTDQVDFMLLLQADLSHRENGDAVLLSAATKLTELDCIEEDGIIQWWDDERGSESEELKKVREKTRALVEFLQQESEDGSEDESEDSE